MSEHADRPDQAVPDEALVALRASVSTALEALARLPDDQAGALLAEIATRVREIDVEP